MKGEKCLVLGGLLAWWIQNSAVSVVACGRNDLGHADLQTAMQELNLMYSSNTCKDTFDDFVMKRKTKLCNRSYKSSKGLSCSSKSTALRLSVSCVRTLPEQVKHGNWHCVRASPGL